MCKDTKSFVTNNVLYKYFSRFKTLSQIHFPTCTSVTVYWPFSAISTVTENLSVFLEPFAAYNSVTKSCSNTLEMRWSRGKSIS